MPEFQNIISWTFISECPIPQDVNELLVEGEVVCLKCTIGKNK